MIEAKKQNKPVALADSPKIKLPTDPATPGGSMRDLGSDANLQKAIDGRNTGIELSQSKLNTTPRALQGSDTSTPAVGRVTVDPAAGRNPTSRTEQQGAKSPLKDPREQTGGKPSGGNTGGSPPANNSGGNTNPWQADRTADDRGRGNSSSDGGGEQPADKPEARDPVHGMTAAEAQAEANKQLTGGMSPAEIGAYAKQTQYETTGQGGMTDQEFKEYVARVKAEQEEIDKNGGDTTPIPDAIATELPGIDPVEAAEKRKRQVGLDNENKRQLDPIDFVPAQIGGSRLGNLINPVDGRAPGPTGTAGGNLGAPVTTSNPTGRKTVGGNQPAPGDPPAD